MNEPFPGKETPKPSSESPVAVDQDSARTVVPTDIGSMEYVRDLAGRQIVTVGDLVLLCAEIRIDLLRMGIAIGRTLQR